MDEKIALQHIGVIVSGQHIYHFMRLLAGAGGQGVRLPLFPPWKEEPVYMEETEPDLLPEAGTDMDLVETDEDTEAGQSGGNGMEPEQEGNKTSGYVAPEREEIHTPEEVAGRSGYIPVQENAEEINEEEAEELRKKYTYGETGKG